MRVPDMYEKRDGPLGRSRLRNCEIVYFRAIQGKWRALLGTPDEPATPLVAPYAPLASSPRRAWASNLSSLTSACA